MRSRPARLLALLLLAISMTGCADDDPSAEEFATKIRANPQMSGAPDKAVSCVAAWYATHASPEQRAALLEGRTTGLEDATPAPGSAAEAALLDCLKLAATTP